MVVFWHHRIGHAAGHNYSRQIRQAVWYDFRKTELEQTQEEATERGYVARLARYQGVRIGL